MLMYGIRTPLLSRWFFRVNGWTVLGRRGTSLVARATPRPSDGPGQVAGCDFSLPHEEDLDPCVLAHGRHPVLGHSNVGKDGMELGLGDLVGLTLVGALERVLHILRQLGDRLAEHLDYHVLNERIGYHVPTTGPPTGRCQAGSPESRRGMKKLLHHASESSMARVMMVVSPMEIMFTPSFPR